MDARELAASPELKQVAARIGRSIGARLVLLFGSAARPNATAEDLDIGILPSQPLDLVAATNQFIRGLKYQAVDLVDLSRADPLILMLAVRDGRVLFEGRVGEFARFASLAARRYADTRKFREAERQVVREFAEGISRRGPP
ncbi:MAG: nucleotidyltransferase domain-containing protein [Gemmatimonadetes bacterium]|nr:nucleotidyltransferase domain-containing protein [Gemmatimonadota bacterium]